MALQELFQIIQARFSFQSTETALRLTLSAFSYSDKPEEALAFLQKHYSDSKSISEIITSMWLETIDKRREELLSDLETTAIWGNIAFVESQFSDLAVALKGRYNLLTILSTEFIDSRVIRSPEVVFEKLNNYGSSILALPANEVVSKFTFLNVIFATERRGGEKTYFPRSVKRVVQAHGLDNSFIGTVIEYSGGSSYDYVLSTSPSVHARGVLPVEAYFNLFPQDLIEHSSAELTFIPCGYPKVDRFIKRFEERSGIEPDSIIYNLSHWSFESAEVKASVESTLEILLTEFSQYNIIFRPFPNDLAIPEIVAIIEKYSNNERFILSSSDDYISDYTRGKLLVCHRGSSSQVFSYATGRPTIIYLPNNSSRIEREQFEYGYGSRNEENFISTVRYILDHPDLDKNRILQDRSQRLAHPGHSVDYLIENLPYIIKGKKNPEWKYYPLYDPSETIGVKEQYIRTCEKILKNKFLNLTVANNCVKRFPEEPVFHFYKAAIYRFHNSAFVHMWEESLKHILEALKFCKGNPVSYECTFNRVIEWFLEYGTETILAVKNQYQKINNISKLGEFSNLVAELFQIPEFSYATLEHYEKLKNENEKLIRELDKYKVSDRNLIAQKLVANGQIDDALRQYEKVLRQNEDDKEALYNSSLLYEQQGNINSAFANAVKYVIADVNNIRAWRRLSDLFKHETNLQIISQYMKIILKNITYLPGDEEIVNILCQISVGYRISYLGKILLKSVQSSQNPTINQYASLFKSMIED